MARMVKAMPSPEQVEREARAVQRKARDLAHFEAQTKLAARCVQLQEESAQRMIALRDASSERRDMAKQKAVEEQKELRHKRMMRGRTSSTGPG